MWKRILPIKNAGRPPNPAHGGKQEINLPYVRALLCNHDYLIRLASSTVRLSYHTHLALAATQGTYQPTHQIEGQTSKANSVDKVTWFRKERCSSKKFFQSLHVATETIKPNCFTISQKRTTIYQSKGTQSSTLIIHHSVYCLLFCKQFIIYS